MVMFELLNRKGKDGGGGKGRKRGEGCSKDREGIRGKRERKAAIVASHFILTLSPGLHHW